MFLNLSWSQILLHSLIASTTWWRTTSAGFAFFAFWSFAFTFLTFRWLRYDILFLLLTRIKLKIWYLHLRFLYQMRNLCFRRKTLSNYLCTGLCGVLTLALFAMFDFFACHFWRSYYLREFLLFVRSGCFFALDF